MRAALLAAAALALGGAPPTAAQIEINEILPNPTGDDVGTERIEVYNAGATSIDVTGWAIDDAATIDDATVRCRLPEDFVTTGCSSSAIIAPGEFRLLKGQSTAAFLNNTGDDVYLCTDRTATPNVVDQVTYPSASAQVDMVWSAVPNGTTNFAWRSQTLCASNGGAGDVTPPATVSNLAAAPGAYPGEVRLTWTAPGDDGASGTASAYEIKVSTAAITSGNFAAATDLESWINEPLPIAGGSPETLFVFGMDGDSTYFFALVALDEAANASGVSNSPSAAPLPGALLDPDHGDSVYFGNLHSHTGYSDGVQTPAAAYAFARNTAPTPLDFLAVTDHNHAGAGMSLPSYALGLSEAAAANADGDFVAIYGQEWGLSSGGHVNLFEAPTLFGWESGNYDVFVAEGDYAGLYTAALANPPSSYPPLALWCHPALSDFDNFQVTANGQSIVHLICLVNGPYNSTATDESDVGNTGFDGAYHEALRSGYRVSPTGDQDNHNATWGASTESRTAVFAASRSKSAILAALAAGRNYATQDHNARVDMTVDGHRMGEAFASAAGVRIVTRVTDPDVGDSVSTIEIFRGLTGSSLATRVAWNEGSAELHWRERGTFAAGSEAHYYVKIRMADNQSIWTGPAYVTYDPATPVASGVGAAPAGHVALALPRPNPARNGVSIAFSVPRSGALVRLAVFDASGRLVRTLLDRPALAGEQSLRWDGRGDGGLLAPSGVYLIRIEADGAALTRKLSLIR
jgi:hypothetical protein